METEHPRHQKATPAMTTTSRPALPATGRRSVARTILAAPFRASTWKQTVHLLLDFPIGFAGVVYALATVVCAGLAALILGVPVLAACVLGGRGWATMERARARTLLAERVAEPRPFRPTGPGLRPWLRAALGDGPGWRGIGYVVLLGLWSVFATAVTIACWMPALMLVTYPIWYGLLNRLSDQPGIQLGVHGSWQSLDTLPEIAAATAVGAVLLLATPWVVHGLTRVDRAMVRGFLGKAALAQQVHDLQTSRSQAVDSAADDRRRIERDLHDGAQARMVAVAMDLGMARTKMTADPDAAAQLVAKAHQEAKQAIAELRDIARGIHPPILTDRGLDGALPTLVARCRVPVDLTVIIDRRPAEAIETIVYYSVAELLTNISKHAQASRASVLATRVGDRLIVEVADDGTGGADPVGGSGLRGVADRLRTIDATMTVTSPPGGPTTVRLELPCAS
jgi:signal transduction histidine kinase